MLSFEWDDRKDRENQSTHGVSFKTAQYAFSDPKRIIAEDLEHGEGILTVRFTHRRDRIRLYGAGYWRKGKGIYEKENSVHG